MGLVEGRYVWSDFFAIDTLDSSRWLPFLSFYEVHLSLAVGFFSWCIYRCILGHVTSEAARHAVLSLFPVPFQDFNQSAQPLCARFNIYTELCSRFYIEPTVHDPR